MSLVVITLIILFLLSFSVRFYFINKYMSPVLNHKKAQDRQDYYKKSISKPPVSIIICAKNEADNLSKFIPSILNQTYKDFEVLIIDDDSNDHTKTVIKSLQSTYSNLRYININPDEKPSKWNSKKWAIKTGIEHAANEILLFTDADCYPASDNWIDIMTANLKEPFQVVVGLSFYEKRKSFLNKIIQFETLQTALLYSGFLLKGRAYMAVGRNLLYTKSLFYHLNGFYGIETLKGGDDDLLIQKIDNQNLMNICLHEKSITLSIPEENYIDYLKQKIRHLNAGRKYKKEVSIRLGLYYLCQALFFGSFAILAFYVNSLHSAWLVILVAIFFIRQYVLYKKFSTKFELFNQIHYNPIVELMYVINFLLQSVGTFFSNRIQWK